MTMPKLKQGSVTLYAQLANILRDKIYSGLWQNGESIPTLNELADEFEVARVTVRQAVNLLSEEGLLSSHRGKRTHVTWVPPSGSEKPLFLSVGIPEHDSATYTVDIFDYQEFEKLPPRQFEKGTSDGPYVRIRKRDLYNGVPYTCSENFVRIDVFRKFRPGGETFSKIAWLIKDVMASKAMTGYEYIQVGMPTDEECQKLLCPSSIPVARITRTFLDAEDQVILYGNYTYNGKEFGLVRDISSYIQSGR
ncbi:GntR family transcriptional regulator [Paracoccus sp. SCSIO 75233]|uniref:GntR family transcriptional regulator n=1 Tax=Paracoccus sp. SCSIO 75233 TaxID=3017782 RepID=UPI0022F0AE1F|nr:GntR family transcriptional regulator [Paracoccus sp. SCSIO 75233]WBU52419.1 GntR family transcriptional regulator [Paracoccus sp. SCSIO 75233]